MKRCSRCKIEKPLSEFSPSVQQRLVGGYCRKCAAAQNRVWHRSRCEYVHARNRWYRDRRNGRRGERERAAADSANKAAFREHIRNGGTLLDGLKLLQLGPVQMALAEIVVKSGGSASLDEILNGLYGDQPNPDDRGRCIKALKLVTFKLRRKFENTGFAFVRPGYAMGWEIVAEGDAR